MQHHQCNKQRNKCNKQTKNATSQCDKCILVKPVSFNWRSQCYIDSACMSLSIATSLCTSASRTQLNVTHPTLTQSSSGNLMHFTQLTQLNQLMKLNTPDATSKPMSHKTGENCGLTVMGLEPTFSDSKSDALPLSYTAWWYAPLLKSETVRCCMNILPRCCNKMDDRTNWDTFHSNWNYKTMFQFQPVNVRQWAAPGDNLASIVSVKGKRPIQL